MNQKILVLRSNMFRKLLQWFRRPLAIDMTIAAIGIPLCALLEYKVTQGNTDYFPPSVYDRLMNREAHRPLPTFVDVSHISREYARIIENVQILMQKKLEKKELQKLLDLLVKLEIYSTGILNHEASIDSEILRHTLNFLSLKQSIAELDDESFKFILVAITESMSRILLLADQSDPTQSARVKAQMKLLLDSPTPYVRSMAISFFYNRKHNTHFDGIVVPMNFYPKDYERDIVFIQGQQSHCFNTWCNLDSKKIKYIHKKPYEISTPWPPLYLDDGRTRLLTVSYQTVQTTVGPIGAPVPNLSVRQISEMITESLSRNGVGDKPVVFIVHSLGAIILKKILMNGARGDLRVLPILQNIKGACFISGPHKPSPVLTNSMKVLQNRCCLMQRFDGIGEIAIPLEESLEYVTTSAFHSKTTVFVSRKDPSKFHLLQEAFDCLRVPAVCFTEGQKIFFKLLQIYTQIFNDGEDIMEGYPVVNFPSRTHTQICKVKDAQDPVLLEIKRFLQHCFK